MKEILRIDKGSVENELQHYSLSLFQGEIVYIQSLSEQSIQAILDVICGKRRLEDGRIYIDETRIEEFSEVSAREKGIYTVCFHESPYEEESIAEYLEPLHPVYHRYSRYHIIRHIRQYLQQESMNFSPEMSLRRLNDVDRKCLEVLRGKIHYARLILLDLRSEIFEGIGAQKLSELMRRLNREGMTFLILSSSYSELSKDAGRIQYLYQGRAVKEWEAPRAAVFEKLRMGNFFQKQSENHCEKKLIGLYDYEVDLSSNFWYMLEIIRENNREVWNQFIQAEIPEYGEARKKNTVLIPRNSQNQLLYNLTIGENLTIAARNRISYGREGIISRKLEKKLVDSFYQKHHISKKLVYTYQLSAFQRKLLSIARWEIIKPAHMILELPYRGIEQEQVPALRKYLLHLEEKGIRIIYFSKSTEDMQEDCSVIIQTKNGTGAKIATFS